MIALASLSGTVQHWVETGGIAAIFLLMAAQCVGVPFPSEVIMPFAGYFAATGHLNLVAAIAVGTLGNLVGSWLAYGLAAWLGEPVLLGPGRYIGIRRHHVELADGWFRRHGASAVFFGRFLPVVRTYISFPAGLARMPLLPFTAYTVLGTLPWCAALGVAGYEVGRNWSRIAGPIGVAGVILAVVLVAAVVAWFVRGRRTDTPSGRAVAPGEKEAS
ncbi:MAG: DedA family protein [Candidatus Dormibacteria bacterium]|jgi:membrane protein DedA with SNARE-associated domain